MKSLLTKTGISPLGEPIPPSIQKPRPIDPLTISTCITPLPLKASPTTAGFSASELVDLGERSALSVDLGESRFSDTAVLGDRSILDVLDLEGMAFVEDILGERLVAGEETLGEMSCVDLSTELILSDLGVRAIGDRGDTLLIDLSLSDVSKDLIRCDLAV